MWHPASRRGTRSARRSAVKEILRSCDCCNSPDRDVTIRRLVDRPLIWAPHGPTALAGPAHARRNHADSASHRPVGGVRRKLGAGRRPMAYSCSGSILSRYGNNLDHPIETIGEMDRDRIVQIARVMPFKPVLLKLVY